MSPNEELLAVDALIPAGTHKLLAARCTLTHDLLRGVPAPTTDAPKIRWFAVHATFHLQFGVGFTPTEAAQHLADKMGTNANAAFLDALAILPCTLLTEEVLYLRVNRRGWGEMRKLSERQVLNRCRLVLNAIASGERRAVTCEEEAIRLGLRQARPAYEAAVNDGGEVA